MTWHDESDNLESLKKDDEYHFSIPFEYIAKNYGGDRYDIATATMEVDVSWSDEEHGYEITYEVPDMYLIDPDEGNGDEESFYESDVEQQVLDRLESLDIGPEAIVV